MSDREKRFAEARQRIKEKLEQERLSRKPSKLLRQPRCDEVYFKGMEWLDSLDQPEVDEDEVAEIQQEEQDK